MVTNPMIDPTPRQMTDSITALDARHIPMDWTEPLPLPASSLADPAPLVVALAGAGCSLAIYDALVHVATFEPS